MKLKSLLLTLLISALSFRANAQAIVTPFLYDTVPLPKGVTVQYVPTYRNGFIYERPVVLLDTAALVSAGWILPAPTPIQPEPCDCNKRKRKKI